MSIANTGFQATREALANALEKEQTASHTAQCPTCEYTSHIRSEVFCPICGKMLHMNIFLRVKA